MVYFALNLIHFKSEDDYFKKVIVVNDYFYLYVCKIWFNQNPRGQRNESGRINSASRSFVILCQIL